MVAGRPHRAQPGNIPPVTLTKVPTGLAVQTEVLSAALTAEQSDQLADLLRQLLTETETPGS